MKAANDPLVIEQPLDEDGFAAGRRPACPHCAAPLGLGAIRIWVSSTIEAEPEPYGSVEISCDRCNKLIYRRNWIGTGSNV